MKEKNMETLTKPEELCPRCNSKNCHQYADVFLCFDCKFKRGIFREPDRGFLGVSHERDSDLKIARDDEEENEED